jgi:hypothetical protein
VEESGSHYIFKVLSWHLSGSAEETHKTPAKRQYPGRNSTFLAGYGGVRCLQFVCAIHEILLIYSNKEE